MSKEKANPIPVVIISVNQHGECDKWYNLKDKVMYDVLCLWNKRGMTEQMYDYFNMVVMSGYQVDVILTTANMKYTCKTQKDVNDLCSLMEMIYG